MQSIASMDPAASLADPQQQQLLANGSAGSELKNQFLTLMLAEIENQDPTNPMDSTEYVTQLAQFSQVESLENIRTNQGTEQVLMENANIVQSASLIGKNALVPTDQFRSDGSTVLQGKMFLEHATDATTVEIKNSAGVVVATKELGPQEEGDVEFSLDSAALKLSDGDYSFKIKASSGDETNQPQTFLAGDIERIHFVSSSGVMMAQMSGGLGTVSVLEISEVAQGNLSTPAAALLGNL
ncbi:flagellar hook capping FlgD N-terminal domain-containing protein [uncultured Ferrimonas sp.]|uniref:flagellar hook assembly protein FlgD n=1 Tax=uncultured Ferrimonas sp. TaxID=432640 RepID=UPI002628F12D|nr:flagellar hook capping FlgD N-terminal domain-containing protein [uncultured Ferrimonas sp.]